MNNWQRLPRTLLIAGLLLGAYWIASPPTGEAAGTTPGDNGHITWELTPGAIERTQSGQYCSSLEVCREECFGGSPQGNYECWPF